MLQILIPIAGPNTFFDKSEYIYPKPLVEINGTIMIQHVIENLMHNFPGANLIFVLKQEDCAAYHLDNVINVLTNGKARVIKLSGEAKGAVCSCLMAIELISKEDQLIICNGDQIILNGYREGYNYLTKGAFDAGVLTFKAVHPKWSYIREENGKVIETAEKNPISNMAIAGVYYYKNASLFIDAAYSTIFNNEHINGLFYLSSTLNELILLNKSVGYYAVNSEDYHSFYSPEKIKHFENHVYEKK